MSSEWLAQGYGIGLRIGSRTSETIVMTEKPGWIAESDRSDRGSRTTWESCVGKEPWNAAVSGECRRESLAGGLCDGGFFGPDPGAGAGEETAAWRIWCIDDLVILSHEEWSSLTVCRRARRVCALRGGCGKYAEGRGAGALGYGRNANWRRDEADGDRGAIEGKRATDLPALQLSEPDWARRLDLWATGTLRAGDQVSVPTAAEVIERDESALNRPRMVCRPVRARFQV